MAYMCCISLMGISPSSRSPHTLSIFSYFYIFLELCVTVSWHTRRCWLLFVFYWTACRWSCAGSRLVEFGMCDV